MVNKRLALYNFTKTPENLPAENDIRGQVDLSLPVPVLAQRFLNAVTAKLSHRNQDFCGFWPINFVVKHSSAVLYADSHRS